MRMSDCRSCFSLFAFKCCLMVKNRGEELLICRPINERLITNHLSKFQIERAHIPSGRIREEAKVDFGKRGKSVLGRELKVRMGPVFLGELVASQASRLSGALQRLLA